MYFLVEITTTDSIAKAIYQYETLNEAKANFHSKLGSWMKNETCQEELVVVMGSDGAIYKTEKFTRAAGGENE